MLATTTKYAIKAVNYLVANHYDEFVQVKLLSKKAGVPGPYLAKIMKLLGTKGIVETKRGILGGVKVSKRVGKLSLYDLCVAIEDPIIDSACMVSKQPCNSKQPCRFHKDWSRVRAEFISFLKLSNIAA